LKRAPVDYAVSMLVAPAIGMFSAWALQHEIGTAVAPQSLAGLAESCSTGGDAQLCTLLTVSAAFWWLSITILAFSILLPLCCVATIRRMAASRNLFARRFPTVLRAYLLLVVSLLAAQACLVLLSGYELYISGASESLYLLFFMIALAIGFFSSAIAIVSDMPRILAIEPVQVTGVLLDGQSPLGARVASVAGRLATAVPEYIVLGLGPRIFATAAVVRLQGDGELNDAVTLYVSAPALHIMEDAELDALIARELGALRGEAICFSRELVPVCSSVAGVISGVELDSERAGTIATLARLPANGFLNVLTSSLQHTQQQLGLQRAQEADQAALELVSARDLVSALAKTAALELRWNVFRTAYDQYMSRGQTRRNLSMDFLTHLARFADATDSSTLHCSLLAASLPDVFGGSIDLASLVATHGMAMDRIVPDVSATLSRTPRRDDALTAYEEHVTALENDYSRVPGRRAVLNTQEVLPAELAAI
jgi:hypothetical protein